MFFVGIDLAWSTRNGTGIAIIEGNKTTGKLVASDVLLTNEEIMNYIEKHVQDKPCFVAIDAPLIVPNETGRREAERLVSLLFRKYHAGAHPSNRQRLSQWSGDIRGETICKALSSSKFIHDPYVKAFEQSRKFFEVFPHPSMVVLFNLPHILRYKAKPKRDYDFRWKEFALYQQHLKKLTKATPSLVLPKKITGQDVHRLKGNALKSYEDMLDAIFCGYIAYYHWCFPNKSVVLGSMDEGYILTPLFDHMNQTLKDIQGQQTFTDLAATGKL